MTSRGVGPSGSTFPAVLAQQPPSAVPMDAEASEAAMEAATRKRAASAPPEPVSGSGGPTHVASSVLVAAYQPAQKAFNAEVQQQARQYASALSKQHAHAAKLRNLRSMKEAGQLPKNLQFQMPRIYGEGMEEVEAIAAAALKEAGHKILDAIVVSQQALAMGATAAAGELAEAAPAKVQAVMSTLPASWRAQPVVITMQQAALENLAFALQRAKDTQEAAASKRQQQAEEKAAAAERAAAEKAPLSIEQQMQKIAEEVVSKRLQQQQQQQQKQRPPRPQQQRPGGSPAQPARPGNPRRRQQQQQQQPQQGRPPAAAPAQPAAPQGAPAGPNRGRQQQQQGGQRPNRPRQPSGDQAGRRGTWADRARQPASGPRNAGQRFQRRHQ